MKLLTNDYFAKHPLKEYSAARMLYTFMVNPDYYDALDNRPDPLTGMKQTNAEELKQNIDAENDPARLIRMLKRAYSPSVRKYLREKLLNRENEIIPLILDAVPKAFNDIFIENITALLSESDTNYSTWIIDHYNEIKYPYTRSALCLVLGFRADASAIPFLMEQVDYFESHNSNEENFDQGPLIALTQLSARFPDA